MDKIMDKIFQCSMVKEIGTILYFYILSKQCETSKVATIFVERVVFKVGKVANLDR